MTPRANRSLPPPFFEIGAMKFQELCADLLAEDPIHVNPVVYARSGQWQRGIDIEAPLRDGKGLHVGQCKAWSEASAGEIRKATDEFLPHLDYWREHGLKKFILLIGCSADDQKSQDQFREEAEKFKLLGLEYEWRDARILRRQLRPHPHIVRNHCEPPDYWVDFICGGTGIPLDPSMQAGVNAVVARHGLLVSELSEASNKELATVLDLWEEGAAHDALQRVQAFCERATWSDLTAAVRSRSLRMHAALTLSTDGDITKARCLLERAKALDPHSCMALEASVVRMESGIDAALQILKAPNSLDAWNVRLGLLLEAGQPETALAELPKLPVQTGRNANTAWAEGLALLCLRRVQDAKRVLADGLQSHPRSFKVRMAMSMLQYAAGVSTVFPAWGHLTWPVPPPWHLVKRDDESRNRRAAADAEFAKLAENVEGDERRELLVWRLACLANNPDSQAEAGELCSSILQECPDYVPALVWAQEREFSFDKPVSISALRRQIEISEAGPDTLIALFALLADTEGLAAAENFLDAQRASFERKEALPAWRAHKVQCLVGRGESEAAQKLVDEEQDPATQHHVRQAMFGAIARKEGGSEILGEACERQFHETGNGEALFSCCLSRRMTKNWAFIADHAEQLVHLVGTDAALRVAVEGVINDRRPEVALRLLQENAALCPGNGLPPDLERLRAEALRQLGHINSAAEAVQRAAKVSSDLSTLVQLFRLQRSKGDLVGVAETAKSFLVLTDVPLQFLTEEVAPAIRLVNPDLTRQLLQKAKQALPPDSPALLLVAQQASKLGMTEIAHEIFGKVPSWANKGVEGLDAVDGRQLADIIRRKAEIWEDAVRNYRSGLIPVHGLCFHFNVILARWFTEAPVTNIENGQPFFGLPILARHAARAGDEPVVLEGSQELFLDVTSVYLLNALGLLETVEFAFPKIAVSAHLAGWIQTEIDRLQPGQPEWIEAQGRVLRLVDSGEIQIWTHDPDFVIPASDWASRMGPIWCDRMATVKGRGGIFVEFMPLRANQPEMEPVLLPETESPFVVGEREIVHALEGVGAISRSEADDACARIGLALLDNPAAKSVILHPELDVHLERGIAERLAFAGVLKPLAKRARVLVDDTEVHRWRETRKRHDADSELVQQLRKLLSHVCARFEADHYRAHEVSHPFVPPDHRHPLSDQELCLQDCFDYALNGAGIWCCDDRFLRGLRRLNRPSIDLYDLVHHLRRIGRLTDDQLYEFLIRFRAANIRYLPTAEAEILYHLRKAPVQEDELIETKALRILRKSVAAALLDAESLQRPQQTSQGEHLLLESELPARLYLACAHCMLAIWQADGQSTEERVARANWLWEHLCFDVRLIQELFGAPGSGMSSTEAAGHSFGHLFAQAIAIPVANSERSRPAYFRWLFDHCIAPLMVNTPEVLRSVAASLRRMVNDTLRELDDVEKTTGKDSGDFGARVILMGRFLFDLPPKILESLELSATQLERLGLTRGSAGVEVLGVKVTEIELWPAIGRALKDGYAAILKPGTRLQLRRDNATGRIAIRRRGDGARDGGQLNVPCIMLLAPGRRERLAALRSCGSWFDLNEPDRELVFQELVEIADPAERMRQLHLHLENSASWFYRQFEERLSSVRAHAHPLEISDLLPESLACLRRHVRLEPSTSSDADPCWPDAVSTLLEQEGLEETLIRLSCLPCRLPDKLMSLVSGLDQPELTALTGRSGKRMQSPLQRIQLLLLALNSANPSEDLSGNAKRDLAKLLDPEEGIATTELLLALLKWSHLRLGWAGEARHWAAETRLRVAWIHAGRLHSALTRAGFSPAGLTQWISGNLKEIAVESICPEAEVGWDSASPAGLTAESLLVCALADFAAQLSSEMTAQLDLPALFQARSGSESRLFSLLSAMWHDRKLRTDRLSSYLGQIERSGLHALMGDSTFKLLANPTPDMGWQRALNDLQADPHQTGAWTILFIATNGAPLPHPHDATMAEIIQRLRLPKLFGKDGSDVCQLILVVSCFVSRNRALHVSDALFSQLLDVAAYASAKFGARSDDEAGRMGAALVAGTWECSVVLGDVAATFDRFTANLSRLFGKWPALAAISEDTAKTLMARIPLPQQRSFWRAALTYRALA